MHMREKNTLTTWIAQQLENLAPDAHFLIPSEALADDPKRLIANIRSQVGKAARFSGINLRVHKDDKGLWIWHDPTPLPQGKKVSSEFDRIISLQQEHKRAQLAGDIDASNRAVMAIHDAIDKLSQQREPPKGHRLAITLPIETILAHIGTTKEIWEMMPPKERLRRRIDAELQIKRKREAESN